MAQGRCVWGRGADVIQLFTECDDDEEVTEGYGGDSFGEGMDPALHF